MMNVYSTRICSLSSLYLL
ncbi:hypothetical protein BpHYR1_040719 [Brachionus plicatilis]|uniref:Uncharacterized protein n=1 Tax=Brachionus plicatilis TaxID=10195 RepID=A0A3M7T8D7_BRAPC|nr:hypothetical protein BpHYR1_040719 [Brachionus plicatilis]